VLLERYPNGVREKSFFQKRGGVEDADPHFTVGQVAEFSVS
jgi:DNA primase